MKWVRKRRVRLQAWQLGTATPMEKRLIDEGRIVRREDGQYELFSQEATGSVGEIASAGDYFKVDPPGCPYPNKRDGFERKHRHIGGDWYEQICEPVPVWTADEPVCEEIRFLLSTGRLQIHPDDPGHYFSARIWGTVETAAKDAVVVFYEIKRNDRGEIRSIDFNFVERGYFDSTYELLDR